MLNHWLRRLRIPFMYEAYSLAKVRSDYESSSFIPRPAFASESTNSMPFPLRERRSGHLSCIRQTSPLLLIDILIQHRLVSFRGVGVEVLFACGLISRVPSACGLISRVPSQTGSGQSQQRDEVKRSYVVEPISGVLFDGGGEQRRAHDGGPLRAKGLTVAEMTFSSPPPSGPVATCTLSATQRQPGGRQESDPETRVLRQKTCSHAGTQASPGPRVCSQSNF